jgi:hypothetical protein
MGILRRMEFAGADAVCVSAGCPPCNVPTSSPIQAYFCAGVLLGDPSLGARHAVPQQTTLVNGVPPYIAAATTGQVNTSILLASSSCTDGRWRQLGDALMKSFTLIALMKPDILGLRLTPDATLFHPIERLAAREQCHHYPFASLEAVSPVWFHSPRLLASAPRTSALLVDKLALAWYRHRCVQLALVLYRRRLHGCGPSLTVEVYADIMPSPTSRPCASCCGRGWQQPGPLAPAPFLSGASAGTVDECVSVCRHARLVRR